MKKIFYILSCVVLFSASHSYSQTNIDFELTSPGTYTSANAVSGWTISSQTATSCSSSSLWTPGSPEFSIIPTPILGFPFIGNIPNSPLGGTKIARLNNFSANTSSTKLLYSLAVTNTNALLCIAYAGILESGTHSCCEQASYKIVVKDASGTPLSCQLYSLMVPGCSSSASFTMNPGCYWTNWQMYYMDLTFYSGTNVTIEIACNDCTSGDHYGTLFFDVTNPLTIPAGCGYLTQSSLILQNNFCGGSIAIIDAPVGYASYTWTAPPAYPISFSQSTLSSITITNALAGNIYTLSLQNSSGCIFTTTDTLVQTSVSIVGKGATSSCTNGASGTATVIASGSGTGYTYSWLNSSNSVIATNYTVNNLSPGVYTIVITAAGSQSSSCGTAMESVTVNAAPRTEINLFKPYCGNTAYLSAPSGTAGSNFQWYTNLTAIAPGIGGTTSSITVLNPSTGNVYRLVYFSSQGCQDSIKFTLAPTAPGYLNLIYNPTICIGAANGTAVFSLVPAQGSPQGLNSFSVFSTGITSPFSAGVNPTSTNSFTATNLFAGGTYTINAFDGSCKYNSSFSVTGYSFNYTLNPANSVTLCSGNSMYAAVSFSIPPATGQFTYSWSPSTYLVGNNNQNAIISPSIQQASITTIEYTVVVTPTLANCPLTKTFSLTIANLPTPSINVQPQYCAIANSYQLTGNPPGGVFSGSNVSSPYINTGPLSAGLYTVFYSINSGSCVSTASSTYAIIPTPTLSVSGNTAICKGQSTTLLASGASSYIWNVTGNGPLFTVSPSASTAYTVSGFNNYGCMTSQKIQIVVHYPPLLSLTGNTFLCAGESTTLSATGANTYYWNNNTSGPSLIVSPNTTTYYTLTGIKTINGCSASETVLVYISSCTGLYKNENAPSPLSVYPNPSDGTIHLDISESSFISIINASGGKILEVFFESGKHELDLSGYANGIYFLKASNKSETKIIKVVKSD